MDINTSTQIIELRAKGVSFSKIAKEVGVSKQTAIDECRRNEERLANLYALEWDELLEKHRITKKERIKAHATLLARIDKEMAQRSLANIPTEKLIELRIKQVAALKEEIIEPSFKSSDEQERDRQERELLNSLTSMTGDRN